MPVADFRWVITTKDGDVYYLSKWEVQRTINKRGQLPPELVYEVRTPGGVIRRLWPEEIASAEQEPV